MNAFDHLPAIHGYRPVLRLGASPWGETLEVVDPVLAGRAVLKLLHPGPAHIPALAEVFHAGLPAAHALPIPEGGARLPSLLTQSGPTQTPACLVYEYVQGRPLRHHLPPQGERLPARTALHVALALARTLCAGHLRQLAHGALHPDNVLLLPGDTQAPPVSLLDYGTGALRAACLRAGLPARPPIEHLPFLAPELRAAALDPTPHADVYALGVLTARLLGLALESGATAEIHATSGVLPPAPLGLPTSLLTLLGQMVQPDPGRRPAMSEVRDGLARASEDLAGFDIQHPLELPGLPFLHYRAQDLRGGPPGLLRLPPQGADEVALTPRLAESAAALKRAAVSGVVPIRDQGRLPDRRTFAFYDLPVGQPLSALNLSGQKERALSVAVALAEALQDLHERNVLCLGLHPEVVWISDDGVGARILDPGTCWDESLGRPDLTRLAPVLALLPPPYLAPDLSAGPPRGLPSEKSDVYALGVLLFQLLSGAPPTPEQLRAPPPKRDDLPFPLQVAAPAVLREEAQLVHQMTAADPAARPDMLQVLTWTRWLRTIELLLGGEKAGRWEVVRKLGPGGMGAVFEVRHNDSKRRGALKLPMPFLPRDRVRQEEEAMRTVSGLHRNLVEILDCGALPDGTPYFVMEYLDGELLSARIARGKLPLPAALRLARQTASALRAVHEHPTQVIHRDLKPDNLMIIPDPEVPGGERIKVFDFGIAKVRVEQNLGAPRKGMTLHGALLGTWEYMAPEQRESAAAVTDRADVWSLGLVLFKMLGVNVLPPPRPLPAVGPPALVRLLDKMIDQDPRRRPAMAEVDRALARLLTDKEPAHAPRWSHLALALLIGILGTAVVGAWWLRPGPRWQVRSEPSGALIRRTDTGAMIGKTPFVAQPRRDLGRPGGPLTLLVQLPGHVPIELELNPEREEDHDLTLRRLRYRLRSTPAGATVRAAGRGEILGQTPLDRPFSDGDPAAMPVQIELPGHRPAELLLRAGDPAEVVLTRWRWRVTSTPSGAAVRAGGATLGQTPWEAPAGTAPLAFSIEKEGYHPASGSLSPDKDEVQEVVLRPVEAHGLQDITAACLAGVPAEARRLITSAAVEAGLRVRAGEAMQVTLEQGEYLMERAQNIAARRFLGSLRERFRDRTPPQRFTILCRGS